MSASDNGEPVLSSSTKIEVIVTDANDNPPRFTQDNYTAVVQVRNACV